MINTERKTASITEQLEELRTELTEQSVPQNWQTMAVSAMRRNPERVSLMMKWLKENKETDYESMDLEKVVLRIKKLVPMEPVQIEVLH